ncbi:hypothetical protein PoB_003379200 [Plakobranchus ocellatus]|uniref:Uncharacterized protein n=1 Tax=Plakobranchus ocellatus TaxID=259542 RepID=A0AAV4AK92_9GAST|nr:hypothetical protein PoB_003379200 [Plakobranchus ocellatus]
MKEKRERRKAEEEKQKEEEHEEQNEIEEEEEEEEEEGCYGFCTEPVYNKMISGVQVFHEARAPVADPNPRQKGPCRSQGGLSLATVPSKSPRKEEEKRWRRSREKKKSRRSRVKERSRMRGRKG